MIEAFGVDAKFLLLINKLLDTRKAPLCVVVWVHEDQSDREEQCRIAKQQSRGDEFSRIGATFVG